jgi:hypothetical protein
MKNSKLLSVLLALTLIGASVPLTFAQQRRGGHAKSSSITALRAARGLETITAEQMRSYLSFIAADEMEGRETPSRGLDTVAKFIALNLGRWGLKPAGDEGTFFQKIALRRDPIELTKSSAEINGEKFKAGDDFIPNAVAATVSGPLVFVGNGWVIKSKNWNPYQGIDVKDKILVVTGGGQGLPPRGITRADLAGRQGTDWISPAMYAQQHGARGIFTIADATVNWEQQRQRAVQPRGLVVEKLTAPPTNPPVLTTLMSAKMAHALFAGEKVDVATLLSRAESGDPVPAFDLDANKKVTVTVAVKTERIFTQNVVGVWEGGDPVLKNEYVAVGAHYDHVGMCAQGSADPICNGADDDGSGTTAMLAMAEAVSHAKQRPKRSILFVWHCGEERGLLGSRYFTEFPTVSLHKVVAQINMDMIGRSKKEGDTNARNKDLTGPNQIYVIGSTMMSTELGDVTQQVNKSFLNLEYNVKYDDPADPNRFFYRSDHFNYARKGIPIIFFFDGVHEDYHRPGDEPQKIDYDKMERVVRTVYLTTWEVANLKSRPKVDKPLPEQLTNRGQ